MAEKPEELETQEEKLQRAKEMFGRGSRNYYVKAYAEAADDLSQACAIFAEIHGATADECGMPYLLYAKSMIAIGQQETKVLDVPSEDEEEEGGGDEEDADGTSSKEENVEEQKEPEKVNGTSSAEEKPATNGHTIVDAQPGTSSGVTANGNSETEEDAQSEANNLEVAWEILELAAIIFARQGEAAYENLAEALTELAVISFENSHFDIAIKDYMKALDVHNRMEKQNRRHVAEIYFQIGLSYLMLNDFDESIKNLQKASEVLSAEIDVWKIKDQTEETAATIKDLEETREEIRLKIVEVEETKQVSVEEVKRELEKLLNHEPEKSANAPASSSSSSSSSAAPAAKANDISHLIKRKKPDAPTEVDVDASPAKKQSIGE
ncbi:protein NASP homolog isoform X2 [Culicoides brevitarsis]|uniref:protein NASP homolog isoform X2 n=1 Tax=Culicoides brevitarsis TaxID=469753 RepID=UPI00307BC80C